ncbi:MAG TPA: META domain-containing protein [Devosia sp.]|nr:META domain-containing protein [Devosia sp.]
MTRRIISFTALLALAAFAAPGLVSASDDGPKVEPAAAAVPGVPAAADTAAAPALPEGVLDATWEWTWFGSGKEQFDVPKPEQYTVQFLADGTMALQVDCNRGRATFELEPDDMIRLSPIGTTMMLCPPGSLDHRFTSALEQVRLFFEKDGDFFLEAPMDSGTLRFRRKAD